MNEQLVNKQLGDLVEHMDKYHAALESLRRDEIGITERFSLSGGEFQPGFQDELADRRRQFVSEWGKQGWHNRRFVLDQLADTQRPTDEEIEAMYQEQDDKEAAKEMATDKESNQLHSGQPMPVSIEANHYWKSNSTQNPRQIRPRH